MAPTELLHLRSAAAICGALLLALVAGPAPAQTVQQRFVGVYRLARYAPQGDHPIGRISYDASGRMWAMLLPPGRKPITRSSSPEEYRDTMRGVVAYYGTYTIDEATGRVIHHVEAPRIRLGSATTSSAGTASRGRTC